MSRSCYCPKIPTADNCYEPAMESSKSGKKRNFKPSFQANYEKGAKTTTETRFLTSEPT